MSTTCKEKKLDSTEYIIYESESDTVTLRGQLHQMEEDSKVCGQKAKFYESGLGSISTFGYDNNSESYVTTGNFYTSSISSVTIGAVHDCIEIAENTSSIYDHKPNKPNTYHYQKVKTLKIRKIFSNRNIKVLSYGLYKFVKSDVKSVILYSTIKEHNEVEIGIFHDSLLDQHFVTTFYNGNGVIYGYSHDPGFPMF